MATGQAKSRLGLSADICNNRIIMEIIKTITEEDFGRLKTPERWSEYRIRPGARAILINELSQIALMHVTKQSYYKLPGGGIDEGEDNMTALKRELLEEVGATNIEIISEIGQVDEFRDEWGVKAEHYCYLAKLLGEITEPSRTEKEIENGYDIIWVDDIDQAIKLVESGRSSIIEYGKGFEIERELAVLSKARIDGLMDGE